MPAVTVFCSSTPGVDRAVHAVAEEAGRGIAERGWTLVYGGTTTGTMASLADGARDAGGRVVAVVPRRYLALGIADRDADELVVVDTLAARKDELVGRADAVLALPGGLGTLDEIVHVLLRPGGDTPHLELVDHAGLWTPLLAQLELMRAHRLLHPTARYAVATDLDSALRSLDVAFAELP